MEEGTLERTRTLPLLVLTPEEWPEQALSEPLALLNDHAHLEKKAALNALELLHQWPTAGPPRRWVSCMTSIARDEVAHLQAVTRILERRGGTMTRVLKNPYAQALRTAIRMGKAEKEIVDRLLV